MKIRGFLVFLILLLIIGHAFAQTSNEGNEINQNNTKFRADKGKDINQINDEIIVPPGENATAHLPMYSKTYIRIYQGTKLDFNAIDPDTNAPLIMNGLILDEVTSPTSAKVRLSVDGSEYQDIIFSAGQEYKINYTYDFMPFMTVTQIITHYEEDNPKDNSIVLYFLLPFPKTSKSDFSQVKAQLPIDLSKVSPVPIGGYKTNIKKSNVLLIMGIIIGLIILISLILGLKKRIMKPKQH